MRRVTTRTWTPDARRSWGVLASRFSCETQHTYDDTHEEKKNLCKYITCAPSELLRVFAHAPLLLTLRFNQFRSITLHHWHRAPCHMAVFKDATFFEFVPYQFEKVQKYTGIYTFHFARSAI